MSYVYKPFEKVYSGYHEYEGPAKFDGAFRVIAAYHTEPSQLDLAYLPTLNPSSYHGYLATYEMYRLTKTLIVECPHATCQRAVIADLLSVPGVHTVIPDVEVRE